MGNRITKPLIGEPCNGCGICCQIQLCNTGAFLLGKTKYLGEKTIKGQCPALIQNSNGSYSCGLIISPQKFIRSKYRSEVISRNVAICVGAGTGCDELGYGDNPEEEMKLDRIIEETKNNPQWRKSVIKAVEIIQKAIS